MQRAAQDAKRQLFQCAGKVLKQKPEDRFIQNGEIHSQNGQSISYSKVIVDFFGSKACEIIAKGL